MNKLGTAALGAAVALSVVSVGDAVARGVSDSLPPWDKDVAPAWVSVAIVALEAVTFLLLAAVLATTGRQVDGGRARTRWVRRVLAGDLVVLTFGVVLAGTKDDGVAVWIASLSFLAMFLLGVVLGGVLVRRPGLRAAGVLMIAPLALLPLAFLADALAPGWGHPGWAETALYVGIALLGGAADREPAIEPVTVPAVPGGR
jgi:hypothetical protein